MFRLLSCQVCTPDLQQSLRVPGLGNWAGLGPGPFLHGVYPLGHSHLPLPDGGTAPRGEHGTWAMGGGRPPVPVSVCPSPSPWSSLIAQKAGVCYLQAEIGAIHLGGDFVVTFEVDHGLKRTVPNII